MRNSLDKSHAISTSSGLEFPFSGVPSSEGVIYRDKVSGDVHTPAEVAKGFAKHLVENHPEFVAKLLKIYIQESNENA